MSENRDTLLGECPFDGCGRRIDPSLFACPDHWRTLPQHLRDEVYAAYREWQRGDIDGDELRRRQQAVLKAARRVVPK